MIKRILLTLAVSVLLTAPSYAGSYVDTYKDVILKGKDALVVSSAEQKRLVASYGSDLENFLYNTDQVLSEVSEPAAAKIDCSKVVHRLCYRLLTLDVRVNGLINHTPGPSNADTPLGATLRLLYSIRKKLEDGKERIKLFR